MNISKAFSRGRTLLAAAALWAAVAGPGQPAAQSTTPGSVQEQFVGKVWVSVDAGAAPGTLKTFLPDGTLLMTSCGETYRLSRWTAAGPGRVTWQEDTARIEAEVVRVTATELQLRLLLKGEPKIENYRLARAPYVCPDMRVAADEASVRVDGTVVYLERLQLPPSAVVRVELRDTSRADAPARTLAAQTFAANKGPPYRFSLSVPQSAIDPRASLTVFADIRAAGRLLFTTATRHPVPRNGAAGVEVRLTFVSITSPLREKPAAPARE